MGLDYIPAKVMPRAQTPYRDLRPTDLWFSHLVLSLLIVLAVMWAVCSIFDSLS